MEVIFSICIILFIAILIIIVIITMLMIIIIINLMKSLFNKKGKRQTFIKLSRCYEC
jgi:hypothetical protein